ncbi:hypothetical protein DL766_007674 [Monosporascus sp. MC13-8B]|uniref:Uncharacterized protein n=1 Tax=Monosporascus cannonballus TaxID=155416 RepID=A0ABY0H377_9PEZI|nr:hypothetical protein DL762_006010 [Monosporascus cannonballus]RYO89173.1 hypothetical protein DL763_005765 [Monosporascus cannonballus]RYP22620.1 hypothetical protein DL766_007674 [Monosporascus sp. MC13-8B]
MTWLGIRGTSLPSFSDGPKPPCSVLLLVAGIEQLEECQHPEVRACHVDIGHLREIGHPHVEELPAQVADGEARVLRLSRLRDARVGDQEVDTALASLVMASTAAWSNSFDAT